MKKNIFNSQNFTLSLVILIDFILASAIFDTHGTIPKLLFLIFMALSTSIIFEPKIPIVKSEQEDVTVEKELEFF